ncbi:TetR family transcriptional regulator [Salinibacterium sp. SYSU T00001]|uniref:TetR/AcrR family transcriptional regulator n=1 Tax=Homoserinimonas sedimenticola TaxID=2986805 RepID=UPI0022358422|nr:TetR/AcrR family transcriptional regulator [Salinibacterium sedimenticola]MCW4384173.1 TetR family transcriptional regulator [Salinibacterium sedimenticola]
MTNPDRGRIIDAAARTFAARGYMRATLHEICSDAGVGMQELSAEFPDKYELFAETVLSTTAATLSASDHASGEVRDSRQARSQIAAVIEATARIMIARRDSSGFYRAEVRHLHPDHREENRALLTELQKRIVRPLAVMRPELSRDERSLIAAAAHSALASITIHPTTLPEPKILTLLTTAAMRVVDSAPATSADVIDGPTLHFPWKTEDAPRWRIHRAAIALFAERGFDAVTMDDIAASSGEPREAIEREFGTTFDILYAGCLEGHLELARINRDALALPGGPRAVLAALCHNYVRHSFEEPDGMTVFLNDGRRLQGEQLDHMLRMQTETVGYWVRTLLEARPELSTPEASFLVFAGLSIVNDLGRALEWQRGELTEARIERLVLAVMASLRH